MTAPPTSRWDDGQRARARARCGEENILPGRQAVGDLAQGLVLGAEHLVQKGVIFSFFLWNTVDTDSRIDDVAGEA